MKTILIFLVLCASLSSCNIIGLTVGYGLMHAQEKADWRKLTRINEQFDEDGWYQYEHNTVATDLYTSIREQNASDLAIFYEEEEFNFLRRNLQLHGTGKDTFECNIASKARFFCDFSPSRDYIWLKGDVPRLEIENGLQCYLQIAPDTIACVFISEKQITIPYLLIASETTIARPKRYVPATDFKTYCESLIDFAGDFNSAARIRINGHRKMQFDTTERFRNFIADHPLEDTFTESPANLDTSKYDLNHKIQFYTNSYGTHLTYRRHFLRHYNSVYHRSRSLEMDVKYCYLAPQEKLVLKNKLDRFFKDLVLNYR